jgi:predicted ATPase
VAATIARALDLRESGGRSARELLVEHLRERQVLLVPDNFEHLLDAGPLLAELLQGCPRLALLVTSRAALRLRSERRLAVAPLATPAEQSSSAEAVASSPAVRLFMDRARTIAPDFVLDPETTPQVAAICRRLDGMPLALELAAARVRLLAPDALLRRLERRLPLLTGGAPDLPERQQTLKQTLAWSHDLLGPGAQVLFRRLAVFEGGGTLEAVERVCNEQPQENTRDGTLSATNVLGADDLLEKLQALVDNSLVLPIQTPTGQHVFAMLETVREYAQERLRQSGEMEQSRTRHLFWCLGLAEDAAPELTGPRQGLWLDRLDEVLDNLRAALNWAQASGQTEVGLRLAGALGRFWSTRRYVGEGREWLERFLEADAAGQSVPAVRAAASYAAGLLANIQGDYAWAVHRLDESTALYREAGDLLGAVRAQDTRGGVVYDQGQLADALVQWEQTLILARAAGSLGDVAHLVGNQGEALFHMGDLAGAETHHTEALAFARHAGRSDVEAMQLGDLGNVARERGDLALATDLQRQALVDAVRAMKAEGSGLLSTIGSLALCRSLLRGGLVDRFRVVMFPVITGATGSERIYDGYPDVALEMIDSRTFDGRIQLVEYRPRVLDHPPLATA